MRIVDLFCGVGGLSRGLASSGFEIVSAYDNWPIAVDAYRKNLRHNCMCMDLSDVQTAVAEISAHKPDMIVGGPPCQDFSTAGRRIESDKASLTGVYATIVASVRPPFALMENVPRVRLSNSYANARETLQQAGYSIYERVFDASLCGVPQKRKRFFMLAWLGDKGNLEESLSSWFINHEASQPLTVKSYLKNEILIEFYYRHPRNYSRRAIFTIYEPSPTIRGVNRPVPPNYKHNHLDSAPANSVRSLTSDERSRIQTFPRSWKWPDSLSKTDRELMIGNAVPVNLAKFIGRGLQNVIG